MTSTTAIWWIRRDLRLHDNPALSAALSQSEQVIPLFILDDKILKSRSASEKRVAFMLENLRSLDADLRQLGGRLVVRTGQPEDVLQELLSDHSIQAIYAERDFSSYARTRDSRLARELPIYFMSQPSVAHPGDVLKDDGDPYTVFTPYARKWKSIFQDPPETLQKPDHISVPAIRSIDIPESPTLPDSVPFPSGESSALAKLKDFTNGRDAGIYRYAAERDRLDLDSTSRLSPYLRFGVLSARVAVRAAMKAIANAGNDDQRSSAESWLNELIWREFYIAILHHFPHVSSLEFQEKFRGLNWENDEEDISAWTSAATGYPVVDACMRQLHSEGWMHNRGRMITASFLVKHLLVDWRIGETHFMQHLIDGDPPSNNGGWQWTAGTGTDAAPYFRIFNPTTQGQRHDPEGMFIRRWVPELEKVPGNRIHEPWKMTDEEQEAAGCVIGRDYPEPIIDHKFARQRALDAYKQSGD
jgi:deoxyribodipyrimidine photo-lyase